MQKLFLSQHCMPSTTRPFTPASHRPLGKSRHCHCRCFEKLNEDAVEQTSAREANHATKKHFNNNRTDGIQSTRHRQQTPTKDQSPLSNDANTELPGVDFLQNRLYGREHSVHWSPEERKAPLLAPGLNTDKTFISSDFLSEFQESFDISEDVDLEERHSPAAPDSNLNQVGNSVRGTSSSLLFAVRLSEIKRMVRRMKANYCTCPPPANTKSRAQSRSRTRTSPSRSEPEINTKSKTSHRHTARDSGTSYKSSQSERSRKSVFVQEPSTARQADGSGYFARIPSRKTFHQSYVMGRPRKEFNNSITRSLSSYTRYSSR
jgi:hypothetical protein